MKNAVTIKELNLIFAKNTPKEFHALKDINLEIKKGEFCILKGVSGSGKSTLLATLAALLKPTSGVVEVFEKPISKLPDLHASTFRKDMLGFVFQHFNLFDELTVMENILTALVPNKKNLSLGEKRANELLSLVGLQDKKNITSKNLSGGEKQRCAIARALINEPQIIIADEPTANLDSKNSENVIEIFNRLNQNGATIIVATHDDIFEKMVQNITLHHIKDGKLG